MILHKKSRVLHKNCTFCLYMFCGFSNAIQTEQSCNLFHGIGMIVAKDVNQ